MKILLSPSETKLPEGNKPAFCSDNFFLPQLFEKREEMFSLYNQHLRSLSVSDLSKWFGLKKDDEALKLKNGIENFPGMKAIERYTGVAFSALDFNSLKKKSQIYLEQNLILFSNLFGPILAGDIIPDYKFKQGAKIDKFNIENFYKKEFSPQLEDFTQGEIIDLRAKFHEKQYQTKNGRCIKVKFLKDGKVVSHWSKHYRGILVRELANIEAKSIEDFFNLQVKGLTIHDSVIDKNIETVTMLVN